jgi:NADPH2:quinone reductase
VTHRAWHVVEHGDPAAVLRLVDVDAPPPGPGQVRLKVAAAGLNFADILLCKGEYQVHPALPFTPGLELAGVVDELGDGVGGLALGQRVLAFPALPHGALAEVALANATDCFPIPDELDDVTTAALGITYQTGWFGLRRRAELQAGETLVVHAGASGVGTAAIQLGKAMGAYVIATAGGSEKVALCRALGADVAIDYRAVDLVDALREATDGIGADVIYDPVGGDVFDASRRCLAFEGRLVIVGFASGRIPDAPANHALVKNYSLLGLHWGLYRTNAPDLVAEAHRELVAMAVDGRITPEIMATRPLEEVPAALALLADRGATGKVVIIG